VDEYRIPGAECPICGHQLDGATPIDGHTNAPAPRSLSVCITCGELLEFTETLQLRSMRPATQAHVQRQAPDAWQLLMRAQRIIRWQARMQE
jgi:hypothetical protein